MEQIHTRAAGSMKIGIQTAEHYIWGNQCDGWHLVKHEDLSIIQEQMPPGTDEVRHYHQKSRQFFFMLTGQAVMEMNGVQHEIGPLEGIEIPPRTPHQIFNKSESPISFLVISHPSTKGDRILDQR